MNFEEQQDYMSEPIDEMSESSYIKINKRFLQQLKQANQIDDLSKYRHQSDVSDHYNQVPLQNRSDDNQMSQRETYQNSPIKSNFYKEIMRDNNDQNEEQNCILRLSQSKKNSFGKKVSPKIYTNQKLYEKDQIFKQTSKILKHSNFDKKQFYTPSDNTFEYYLLRKSHDKKHKQPQFISEINSYNQINQMQTKPKLFSPQNQFSSSNRQFNPKQQFQRINYKKLLQNQISKNKQLEKHIYKLQFKLSALTLQFDQSTKSTKKLQKDLITSQKIRKQNKNRMKDLDGKLEGLKNVCKIKNIQKDNIVLEIKKQNKLLKQENQKYKFFVQTLSESIFVLKGKKPKNLQDIWNEWRDIFESFSKHKWTLIKTKSPNRNRA